ncbi:enoyl-CoA hydratase/isomerase family protein [bacterium]|nr:enoyl-CoA hydratase/isomerase family protein [bacterium]
MARTAAPRRRPGTQESPGDAVLFDLVDEGRVALVTLNRPERRNAYDVAMRDALYAALTAVRDDPAVRALVLCGNGPAFSTGGDVAEFGSAPSPLRAREVRWLRDVWGTLWSLPAITIAAVHGYAVGGGFEMALLCDQCLAAADARFALPETGLGMIPGVAGTQTLPRLTGLGRALHYALTGAWLDAEEARACGLVSRIVPRHALLPTALATARAVARLPAGLAARLKRAVNEGTELPLGRGLALERRLACASRSASRRASEAG